MISLASLQTPEDLAHANGNCEVAKILKEYAEVCGSVVMKGCVLNLDAFLSHFQSIALSLSLSQLLFFSLCHWLLFALILNSVGHQRACL